MSPLGIILIILLIVILFGGLPRYGFGWYQGGPGSLSLVGILLVVVIVLLLLGRI